MFVLTDTGLQYLNMFIRNWYMAEVQRAKKAQMAKDMQNKTVIKRKVSTYNCKQPHSSLRFSI